MIDEDGSDMQREEESPRNVGFGNQASFGGTALDDDAIYAAENKQIAPSASEEQENFRRF